MIKPVLTPDMIVELLARIPEGFIHRGKLADKKNTGPRGDAAIQQAVDQHKIGRDGSYLYDKSRMDKWRLDTLKDWCQPSLPATNHDGRFLMPPIWDRRKQRLRQFGDPIYVRIFDMLENSRGYLTPDQIATMTGDQPILWNLVQAGALDQLNDFIFDPLMLSFTTMEDIVAKQRLLPLHRQLIAYLQSKPGTTASIAELQQRFQGYEVESALSLGGVVRFDIQADEETPAIDWVRLDAADAQDAQQIAAKTLKVADEKWEDALLLAGSLTRADVHEGESRRMRVLARTYTLPSAARRLGVSEETLNLALHEGRMSSFDDPEGMTRVAAADIENALADPAYLEQIAAHEIVKIREIALALDIPYPAARKRLRM